VRWGDKGKEMELVPMPTYIAAIKRIAQKQGMPSDALSVFLTTEDPLALAEFRAAAPPTWHIFVYEAAVSSDASVHSQKEEATINNGASGRHALVALLLAMEADHFVLTTGYIY